MKKILSILILTVLTACSSVGGSTKPEKQSLIQKMERDVISALYKSEPQSKSEIAKAKAYAVFSNININLLVVAVGNGYGVLREKNHSPLYMKMGEAGVGLGMGGKDFKLVMIFNDQQALNAFKEGKLSLAGNADAVAKSGEKGGGAGVEGMADKIKVYQITESGLALQATVKGTKYWIDPELN